jgi:hypothetical protein
MKRNILYRTLTVGVIVAISLLWLILAMRQPDSENSPVASQSLDRDEGGNHYSNKPTDSDTRSEAPERTRRARERTPQDQRAALERAVAVQEKLVEEKKAALAQWVRTNGVVYNPSDHPDTKVPDNEVKRVTVGGSFVDLKNDYEVELRNLERMKGKLDEL